MDYNKYIKEKQSLNKEYNRKFEALKKEHHQKLDILKKMLQNDSSRKSEISKNVKKFKGR